MTLFGIPKNKNLSVIQHFKWDLQRLPIYTQSINNTCNFQSLFLKIP